MIQYTTTIKKFDAKGEKTGWTYIEIPAAMAQQLIPGNKKSFRVKGKLDAVVLQPVSILPMGEGNFILPLNQQLRRQIKKQAGETIHVALIVENSEYELNADFINCLQDEPAAWKHFNSLPKGHRNYFSKWIEQAKANETRIKRITKAVIALSKGWGYAEMIRDKTEI